MPVRRSAAGTKLVNSLKKGSLGRKMGPAKYETLFPRSHSRVTMSSRSPHSTLLKLAIIGVALVMVNECSSARSLASLVAAPHCVLALVEVAALHRGAEDHVVGLKFLAHSRIEAPFRAGGARAVRRRVPELGAVDVRGDEKSRPAFAIDLQAVVVVLELGLDGVLQRGELALDLAGEGRQGNVGARA